MPLQKGEDLVGITNKLNLKEGIPAVSSGCLLFPEMKRGKHGMEQGLVTTICFKELGGVSAALE